MRHILALVVIIAGGVNFVLSMSKDTRKSHANAIAATTTFAASMWLAGSVL